MILYLRTTDNCTGFIVDSPTYSTAVVVHSLFIQTLLPLLMYWHNKNELYVVECRASARTARRKHQQQLGPASQQDGNNSSRIYGVAAQQHRRESQHIND